MKTFKPLLLSLLFSFVIAATPTVYAQGKGTFSHVILVWLKEPGNQQARQNFVNASKKLNQLPGIINRHVGVVKQSDRAIVDDSFDVAVTVTLKDEAAYHAYMNAPLHKKIVAEELKPMINKIVAYDFVSE